MKRGIFINLTIFFILAVLVASPFLIMLGAGLTADLLGCEMSGGAMPDGVCGTLYAILLLVGWSSIAIVPVLAGVLGLYLLGVTLMFVAGLILAAFKGGKISPVVSGMMVGNLIILLVSGLVAGGLMGAYWWRYKSTQIIGDSRCEALFATPPASTRRNGPLALSVQVPADPPQSDRSIVAVTPEGELVFQLDGGHWARTPAWSPDGSQLAFVAQNVETRRFDLHLATAQGRAGPAILPDRAMLDSVAWLADGQTLIVADQAEDKDTELFAVNVAGGEPRRLTFASGFDGSARVSPDGTTLAFVSRRNGHADIYLMNSDGSNERRLTNHPADDIDPAWSPDGRWLVFASNRGSGMAMSDYDLFITAVDGGSTCQLTQTETPEQSPVWSPDGQWVAYLQPFERQAWLMRLDGSDNRAVLVPVTVGDIYELDWAADR